MDIAELSGTGLLAALLGIWGTYLLGLLIPGPNFIVIAGAAALHGLRGSFPLILSIVAGTCLQVSAMVSAIALLPRGGAGEVAGQVVGAVVLIAIAIYLLRASNTPRRAAAKRANVRSVGVLAGLSIGLCNPITLGGVAAQLLGPSAVLIGSVWGVVAVLGVAVLGFLRSFVIALLFASAAVQGVNPAIRRGLTGLVAVVFAVMGLVMIGSLAGAEVATATP